MGDEVPRAPDEEDRRDDENETSNESFDGTDFVASIHSLDVIGDQLHMILQGFKLFAGDEILG